jgi:hypothetical protein
MVTARFLFIALLMVLVAGCSSPAKKAQAVFDSPIIVDVQYDEEIDFNQYKTWTWLPGASALTGRERLDDPRFESHVKAIISGRLFERGFRQDNTQPNLFVNYYASVEDIDEDVIESKYDGIYSPDYHMELPESEKKKKRQWEEGTLFIFVFDSQTKQVVWYGSAQAEVYGEMPDKMRGDRIRTAIEMMMEGFPSRTE